MIILRLNASADTTRNAFIILARSLFHVCWCCGKKQFFLDNDSLHAELTQERYSARSFLRPLAAITVVLKEEWLFVRGSFTWKYEKFLKELNLKEGGCLPACSFTWKYEVKGFRKSGLKRAVASHQVVLYQGIQLYKKDKILGGGVGLVEGEAIPYHTCNTLLPPE